MWGGAPLRQQQACAIGLRGMARRATSAILEAVFKWPQPPARAGQDRRRLHRPARAMRDCASCRKVFSISASNCPSATNCKGPPHEFCLFVLHQSCFQQTGQSVEGRYRSLEPFVTHLHDTLRSRYARPPPRCCATFAITHPCCQARVKTGLHF